MAKYFDSDPEFHIKIEKYHCHYHEFKRHICSSFSNLKHIIFSNIFNRNFIVDKCEGLLLNEYNYVYLLL